MIQGKAGGWTATDADTLDIFPPGEIEAAVAEDRVWLYCGLCGDGCHRTTLEHTGGEGHQ